MTDHSNTQPIHPLARVREVTIPASMAEVPAFLRILATTWSSHGTALSAELANAMMAGSVTGAFQAGIGTGLTQLVAPVLQQVADAIEAEQAREAEADAKAWESTAAALAGLDAAIAQAEAEGTPFGQAFATELRAQTNAAGPWWVHGAVYGMYEGFTEPPGTCRLDVLDQLGETRHLVVDYAHLGLNSTADYLRDCQRTGTDAYVIIDLGSKVGTYRVTGYANPVTPGIHAQAVRDTVAFTGWLDALETAMEQADATPAHGITRPGEYGNSESHL